MLLGTPHTIPGERGQNSHGGAGSYFVRTLLSDVPGSAFKYMRDLTLDPGARIGEHAHQGDDEVYFVISGSGVMTVDGEQQSVGPGTAVLTRSGSTHGLDNAGVEPLRIFVACAKVDS